MLCPILVEVQEEIESNPNIRTDRRMSGFNKLVQKITDELGRNPTDDDLRHMGRARLMELQTNNAERNVAGKIARIVEK